MSKKLISLLLLLTLFTSFGGLNLAEDTENSPILLIQYSSSEIIEEIVDLDNSRSVDQISNIEKINRLNTERLIEFNELDTHITTNKSEYKPGETILINTTSSQLGINGSSSWNLKSPLNEEVFSFNKDANTVFFDENSLSNQSIADWQNFNFDNVYVTEPSGENWLYLQTTTDSQNATFSYNKYTDIEANFSISFEYKVDITDNLDNLTFSYWNGTNIVSLELENQTSFTAKTINGVILNSKTLQSSLFNFSLDQSNATWVVKSFNIVYEFDNIDLLSETEQIGNFESIWIHGPDNQFRDIIDINFNLLSSETDTHANFFFKLPDTQLYFGEWQFEIFVNPFNDTSLNAEQHSFILPILISDEVELSLSNQFIHRGTNTTSNQPLFKDETGITDVFSPSDNISYIGRLISNSAWNFNESYFVNVTGYILSNSGFNSNLNLTWGSESISKLVGYSDSNPIYDGYLKNQLSPTFNNSESWMINFNIPNRGIYGDANQTLILSFPSYIETNLTNNLTISQDYNMEIDLNPIQIKFDLNVTSSLNELPFDQTWFITDLMEGSFSPNTWRFNSDSLIINNSSSDISYNWNLSIPLTDLNFTIGLNDNTSSEFSQIFQITLFKNKFYFSGSIDANLKTNELYLLKLRWNTPKDEALSNIELIEGKILSYMIGGTLTVQLPQSVEFVKQGDSFSIPFNVTIDQFDDKRVSGLILQAEDIVPNNESRLQIAIIEGTNEGNYRLISTVPINFPVNEYSLDITSSHGVIGTFTIEVIPFDINPDDKEFVTPVEYVFIGFVLTVIVTISFVLGMLQRFYKK